MKLLSIGNSFSQDAQEWLHKIAVANGVELETTNLMIGGCSLETHWNNMNSGEAAYYLEQNAQNMERKEESQIFRPLRNHSHKVRRIPKGRKETQYPT